MVYSRGDIVLVNFNPQKRADEVAKVRPAIIVSDSQLNEVLDLVSVVAMTTNLIDDALPLRVRITQRDDLIQDSDAMIEQLRSVSKSRISQKLSTLTPQEMQTIDDGIKAMLALN